MSRPFTTETAMAATALMSSARNALRRVGATAIARVDRDLADEIATSQNLDALNGAWRNTQSDASLQVFCLLAALRRAHDVTEGLDHSSLRRVIEPFWAAKEILLDLDGSNARRLDRHFANAMAHSVPKTSPALQTLTALLAGFALLQADVTDAQAARAKAAAAVDGSSEGRHRVRTA